MNKLILVIMLLLTCSLSACGQENWGQWTNEKRLSDGTVLSVRYDAPPDSGEVHIVFVTLDTAYCYGGYQVRDRFPPYKYFDIIVKWKDCEDPSEIVSDSTKLRYEGEEKEILYNNKAYSAEVGSIFAIVIEGPKKSIIRRFSDLEDLEGLPSATQNELHAFFKDSFSWSDIKN